MFENLKFVLGIRQKAVPAGEQAYQKIRKLTYKRNNMQPAKPVSTAERWHTTSKNAEIIDRNNKKLVEDLNNYYTSNLSSLRFAVSPNGRIGTIPVGYLMANNSYGYRVSELSDKQIQGLIEIMRNKTKSASENYHQFSKLLGGTGLDTHV